MGRVAPAVHWRKTRAPILRKEDEPPVNENRGAPSETLGAPRVRPRDVRDMTRIELEGYAKELTMGDKYLQLSDDRLRQNIQAFLIHTRE